jgi:hypothetical protein
MTVDTDQNTEPPEVQIQEPEKLIRLAAMAKFMLEEARSTPCDTAGCERFRRIYERTLHELGELLSEDLQVELAFLTVTFEKSSPTPSELQIAQAELVGWLEGLFNGIAGATMSQQSDAHDRARAIAEVEADDRPMPGQYL